MLHMDPLDLFILYLEVCTLWPPSSVLPIPHLLPLAATHLLSLSLRSICFICFVLVLFVLDFTYRWDYMIFVFLCLTCFPQHNALKVHPCCCNDKISPLLWLNNILGNDYVYMYIMYIYNGNIDIYKVEYTYEVCLEKVQSLLIGWERFTWHQCNLAAKDSGL